MADQLQRDTALLHRLLDGLQHRSTRTLLAVRPDFVAERLADTRTQMLRVADRYVDAEVAGPEWADLLDQLDAACSEVERLLPAVPG